MELPRGGSMGDRSPLLLREIAARGAQMEPVRLPDPPEDPPYGDRGGGPGQDPHPCRAAPTGFPHGFLTSETSASESGENSEPAKSPVNRMSENPARESISQSSSGEGG